MHMHITRQVAANEYHLVSWMTVRLSIDYFRISSLMMAMSCQYLHVHSIAHCRT